MARPDQNKTRRQIQPRVNGSGDVARIHVSGVRHKTSDGALRRKIIRRVGGREKRIDLLFKRRAIGGIESAGDSGETNHARTWAIQAAFEGRPRTFSATDEPARNVTTTLSPF